MYDPEAYDMRELPSNCFTMDVSCTVMHTSLTNKFPRMLGTPKSTNRGFASLLEQAKSAINICVEVGSLCCYMHHDDGC